MTRRKKEDPRAHYKQAKEEFRKATLDLIKKAMDTAIDELARREEERACARRTVQGNADSRFSYDNRHEGGPTGFMWGWAVQAAVGALKEDGYFDGFMWPKRGHPVESGTCPRCHIPIQKSWKETQETR